MITGILIVDSDDNIMFTPNAIMYDSDFNHERIFQEMSVDAIVLSGSTAFTKEKIQSIAGPGALVFENVTIQSLIEKYPWKSIVVVGNIATLKSWKYLTDLMVVRYKSLAHNPTIAKFDCPCYCPSKKTANLTHYTVTHYEMDPIMINTPLL
jgi:hypothetical protein